MTPDYNSPYGAVLYESTLFAIETPRIQLQTTKQTTSIMNGSESVVELLSFHHKYFKQLTYFFIHCLIFFFLAVFINIIFLNFT